MWLLLPLSFIYCIVITVRQKLYQLNFKRSYASQVPVVVIGNIVVGGSGKTPLLISLCEYLKEKGFNPGVVSRGYGGSVSGVKQVAASDSATLVGDEPLMVHRHAAVPVVVGSDRVAAVQYLLSNNHCDVVLSDDGLQHYRMRRDFEIAVVDSSRRFGNGFCIPAGPLRERTSRLNDVDLVIYNGSEGVSDSDSSYQLQINSLQQLNGSEKKSLSAFSATNVHAIAGIGHPERFFRLLNDHGVDVVEHAYADHHDYQQKDFDGWTTECIIMTEKDAVKCQHLSLENAWVLSVDAVFSPSLELSLSSQLLPLLSSDVASVQ